MSWNFSAIYVDTGTPDKRTALERETGRAVSAAYAYSCLRMMDGEIPEDDKLAELSQRWDDLVFMWIDAHSDMLQYQHWRSGEKLRLIEKDDNGCWASLDGEPESWEAALFRDQRGFEDMCAFDPDQAEPWREIWQGGQLVEDSQCPFSGPEDLASVVARELNLELFPPKV